MEVQLEYFTRERKMNNRIYVFDIDGTVADCTHRLSLIDKRIHPKAKDRDYNRFFEELSNDAPIDYMVDLCRTLISADLESGHFGSVVFLTGRPERTRDATVDWLNEHNLTCTISDDPDRDAVDNLIMRDDGDNRPSEICKRDLIQDYFTYDEMKNAIFFEDSPDNIKMMRDELNLNVVVIGDGKSFSEGHFDGTWIPEDE